MHAPGPGFSVIDRWRLHEGKEDDFVAAWSRITGLLRAERGSLGHGMIQSEYVVLP